MAKRVRVFLAVVMLILFTAGVIQSARIDPKKTASTPLLTGDESLDHLMTNASGVFQPTILSPYDTVLGYTWYDYQHNCRIPRMIANDYQIPRGLHFTFMELAIEPWPLRCVDYNYWDTDGWTITPPSPGRITHIDASAGYTGLDLIRPLEGDIHSRAVVCYHTNKPVSPNPEPTWVALSIEPNSPGEIAMQGDHYWYDVPDYGGTEVRGSWPACGVDSLNRIHVVMREGYIGICWLGYIRCQEREGDILMCWAPGKDSVLLNKETYYTDQDYEIELFDQSGTPSHTVATSKISNKVALFWTALAESEEDSSLYEDCNDIFYIESTNGGDDWLAAGSMPPRKNVTNYGADDYVRAHGDVAAFYDLNDSLHIFWHTHYYNQATGDFDFNQVSLWHWSKATEKICEGRHYPANKIAAANWSAYPGRWDRLISKVQAGVGIVDSAMDPEHYNLNYLYAQWIQFDPDKTSQGDYTQGDIYITVSTDLGFTWHQPVNTTNSTVPDCVPGECASDHWASMAEWVDTCAYIQWIYDLDAGGLPQGEGGATNNPVLFRAFPTDSIPIQNLARINWTPRNYAPPPLLLHLNSDTTLYLNIDNLGTATLQNISLSSDADGDWLTIGSCPASIPAGGCPAIVTLNVSPGDQETYLIDSIRIQSSDEVGNHDVYVGLQVIVSDEYKATEFDIIENPTFKLSVSNTGNLGHQNDTAGFYLHQDPIHPNFLFDGSPVIGFISPDDDTLVGRDNFDDQYFLPATDLSVDTFPDLKTIVTQTEFWPARILIPLVDQYWPWWKIRMKDYIFFSEAENKNEQYVALKVLTLLHDQPPGFWPPVSPPAVIPESYLGMALDIDCPSDTGSYNRPAYDQSRRMVYLQGYGIGVVENYRMAVAQKDTCWEFEDGKFACWPYEGDPNIPPQVEPYAMHILRNNAFVYPEGSFRDDSLYKYMKIPGYSIYGDTIREDYSILTTGAKIDAHSYPDSTVHCVVYALVISDEWGDSTLNHRVDMISCGNVDRDMTVNVSDVVYYINYLLKSGSEIWLYMGDCDGNGLCDIADIVYLINYLFKSGPPPQCSFL